MPAVLTIDETLALRRTRRSWSKVTAGDVRQIRSLHASGTMRQSDLARMFNLSPSGIYRILQREVWQDIE